MNFAAAHTRPRKSWLSLTPLVDIVFLLLIFFMLTTSLTQNRSLPLDIPGEKGSGQSVWKGATLIRIHTGGRIDLNGRATTVPILAGKVETLLAKQKNMRFIVRPDNGLPIQQIVDVMDQLRMGGASSISLIR